jgi:hypothetical protein
MKKSKISTFIHDLLLEVALDSRVESGIVNIKNYSHLEILGEHMFDMGLSSTVVASLINELVIQDGKYPDRQAYNKDGWLVTFPSAEYMQAAIKKGTHYKSDPTHGKGGMNLYYKKKGQQKRQSQQDVSQTENPQQAPQTTPPQKSSQVDAQPTQQSQTTVPTSDGKSFDKSGESQPVIQTNKGNGPTSSVRPSTDGDSELPKSGEEQGSTPQEPSADKSAQGGSSPQPPSSPTPPTGAPKPVNVGITIEFAKAKNWSPTPYGEWRSSDGEISAVVSLSGEITPIKSNDREELKLFASKKTSS